MTWQLSIFLLSHCFLHSNEQLPLTFFPGIVGPTLFVCLFFKGVHQATIKYCKVVHQATLNGLHNIQRRLLHMLLNKKERKYTMNSSSCIWLLRNELVNVFAVYSQSKIKCLKKIINLLTINNEEFGRFEKRSAIKRISNRLQCSYHSWL